MSGAVLWWITVSLENLVLDVSELEKGIEATRRELQANRESLVLETFLADAEVQMSRLKVDCKKAQVRSISCYYY